LISDDAWNAAVQKIVHDRLADKAQAARYYEFQMFAHRIACCLPSLNLNVVESKASAFFSYFDV